MEDVDTALADKDRVELILFIASILLERVMLELRLTDKEVQRIAGGAE